MTVEIRQGDARAVLATLPAASVHACITSPPYYGLRCYGGGPQEIGTETTPAEYVAHLVAVLRAVHRVLRDAGTCWLVLGDSFSSGNSGRRNPDHSGGVGALTRPTYEQGAARANPGRTALAGMPAKNLLMIPHRVAIALQADGWYVRNDCVWTKGSAMPESVQDRFSRVHEYVFHLAKSERYYFDAIAVAEPAAEPERQRDERSGGATGPLVRHSRGGTMGASATRNRRSVLHINPQPFSAARFGVKDTEHYAVMPEKLVELLTLCSTSEAGCCPACGAPYRRVVERSRPPVYDSLTAKAAGLRATGMADHRTACGPSGNGLGAQPTRTTGWQPGCSCDAGPPIPCTTLDPFLGAGTVALVSKRLGRSCVGIELNESYCEMARRRVESVPYTLFSGAASTGGAAR